MMTRTSSVVSRSSKTARSASAIWRATARARQSFSRPRPPTSISLSQSFRNNRDQALKMLALVVAETVPSPDAALVTQQQQRITELEAQLAVSTQQKTELEAKLVASRSGPELQQLVEKMASLWQNHDQSKASSSSADSSSASASVTSVQTGELTSEQTQQQSSDRSPSDEWKVVEEA